MYVRFCHSTRMPDLLYFNLVIHEAIPGTFFFLFLFCFFLYYYFFGNEFYFIENRIRSEIRVFISSSFIVQYIYDNTKFLFFFFFLQKDHPELSSLFPFNSSRRPFIFLLFTPINCLKKRLTIRLIKIYMF